MNDMSSNDNSSKLGTLQLKILSKNFKESKKDDTNVEPRCPGYIEASSESAMRSAESTVKHVDSDGAPVFMRIVARTPPTMSPSNMSVTTSPDKLRPSPNYSNTSPSYSNSSPDMMSPDYRSGSFGNEELLGYGNYDIYHLDEESGDEIDSYKIEKTRLFRDDSETYNKYHGKPSDKSIMSDLSTVMLSDDVKAKADEIFRSMDIPITRGKRRRKVVFYCVLQAHRKLGITRDPKELANSVGINPNEISRSKTMCSTIETGYQPEQKKSTPLEFIPIYYPFTGLISDGMSNVFSLVKDVLKKDSDLNDQFPQTVAAGALIYYMDINGVKYDKSFSRQVGKSEVTLKAMAKRIATAHNS